MNYAEAWDAEHKNRLMIARDVDPRFRDFAQRTYGQIKQRDRWRVKWLDLGCGTGLNTMWLAQIGFSAVGIDSSPAAIDRAHKFVHHAKNHTDFLVFDMTHPNWPFKAEFDAAVDIRSLENLTGPEIQRALMNVRRALKRDGKFFSLMAGPLRDDSLTTVGWVYKPKKEELEIMMRVAGFRSGVSFIDTVEENGRIVEDWHIEAVA